MKILMINGSTRARGCTYTALAEMGKLCVAEGVNYEIIHLGRVPVRNCAACNACDKNAQHCVFDDNVINEIITKAWGSDGFIFGAPISQTYPNGRVLSVLDRVFHAGSVAFYHKPAATVITAFHPEKPAALDVLNNYFAISQTPIIPTTYWNILHGSEPINLLQDAKGMHAIRNLAHNMMWLLKCIESGRSQGVIPPKVSKSL